MKEGINLVSNVIRKKLNICDYVFEYQDKSLRNGELIYYFDELEHVYYENDKRNDTVFEPVIGLEIRANDENDQTFSFGFMINMNLEQLNSVSSDIVNINEHIVSGEIFFSDLSNQISKQIYLTKETDKYANPANIWIAKIDFNKILVKISIPEEKLFIWFHMDLN